MKSLLICPHCQNNREDLMELLEQMIVHALPSAYQLKVYLCGVCAKSFMVREDE